MALTWQIDTLVNVGPAPYNAPAVIDRGAGRALIAKLDLVTDVNGGATTSVIGVSFPIDPDLTGAALRDAVIAQIEETARAWEAQIASVQPVGLGAIPATPTAVV